MDKSETKSEPGFETDDSIWRILQAKLDHEQAYLHVPVNDRETIAVSTVHMTILLHKNGQWFVKD